MNKKREAWFFLRGLVRESAHWHGFLEKFATAFPDREVVTLDLPGNGVLHHLPSPTSVSKMTDLLREEFLRRKLERNFLCAVSLGGMAGIDWMHRYPEDFEGAVLLNTSLKGVCPIWKRLRPGNYLTILALMALRDPLYRETKILEMTSERRELHREVARHWAEIQRQRPVSVRNALRQLLAAVRFSPPLSKPKASVKLLRSLGDRLVHPDCSARVAELWSIPLETHPAAGHDLTLDAPDWVLERLQF